MMSVRRAALLAWAIGACAAGAETTQESDRDPVFSDRVQTVPIELPRMAELDQLPVLRHHEQQWALALDTIEVDREGRVILHRGEQPVELSAVDEAAGACVAVRSGWHCRQAARVSYAADDVEAIAAVTAIWHTWEPDADDGREEIEAAHSFVVEFTAGSVASLVPVSPWGRWPQELAIERIDGAGGERVEVDYRPAGEHGDVDPPSGGGALTGTALGQPTASVSQMRRFGAADHTPSHVVDTSWVSAAADGRSTPRLGGIAISAGTKAGWIITGRYALEYTGVAGDERLDSVHQVGAPTWSPEQGDSVIARSLRQAARTELAYDEVGQVVGLSVTDFTVDEPENPYGAPTEPNLYAVTPPTSYAGRSYYSMGGRRVAMRDGAEVRYVHSDHLRSSTLVTNSSGAVVSRRRFMPFGAERWSSGTSPTDLGFTGEREIGATSGGLVHMGARFYDPGARQWLSADSIVPDASNPQTMNRYAYVTNNPVRYRDPSGHDGEDSSDPPRPDFGNWFLNALYAPVWSAGRIFGTTTGINCGYYGVCDEAQQLNELREEGPAAAVAYAERELFGDSLNVVSSITLVQSTAQLGRGIVSAGRTYVPRLFNSGQNMTIGQLRSFVPRPVQVIRNPNLTWRGIPVQGTTNSVNRVWLRPGASNTVLAHEFGHIVTGNPGMTGALSEGAAQLWATGSFREAIRFGGGLGPLAQDFLFSAQPWVTPVLFNAGAASVGANLSTSSSSPDYGGYCPGTGTVCN